MNVKNCEVFAILLYLQANRLAFRSFVNTDHKYVILGSETKDSIFVKATAVFRVKSLVPAPCSQGNATKAMWHLYIHWIAF